MDGLIWEVEKIIIHAISQGTCRALSKEEKIVVCLFERLLFEVAIDLYEGIVGIIQ